ncbi:MAG: right-handed parallel beta-helix repeat-containing protein [Phycisphaerales bacterium]|nr:right-handed parallel beta-helix repeat-containing protein [Phycisphaerales bacterium]
MKRVSIVSAVVVGLAGGAVILFAGPLNPPAGAVSSTYKTLTEVEPRIAINAANTPGDADSLFKITQPGSYYLTGSVTGVSGKRGIEVASSNVTIDLNGFALIGVASSLDGIGASVSVTGVTILNGVIRSWGDGGIDFYSPMARDVRIQGITASTNTGDGISLERQSLVKDCVASGNGANGFDVYAECVIENCVASSNIGDGFFVGALSVVSRCEAHSNGGNGIRSNNNGYSSIFDCVSSENIGSGIYVHRGTLVARNNCAFNTAAGIFVSNSDNRIEANTCISNGRGIDVDLAGNIIVRNTSTGSFFANWDVVAGNVILVVNATTAGAVSGDSGGTAPGSTDPNANFSY